MRVTKAQQDLYKPEYFDQLLEGSQRSARAVVPHVIDLLQPRSVIDVGCGVGAWLAMFAECGVEDMLGVDGDYVDRGRLLIPVDRFVAWDLTTSLQLNRRFDLVVSLEVAEHLPERCASDFVQSLTSLAPVVLFSAAIPFQRGKGHVNEQWPQYWAELFAGEGYVSRDVLRSIFWTHPDVEWWYAQNMVIYARQDSVAHYPGLAGVHSAAPLPLVHPRRFGELVEWVRKRFGDEASDAPRVVQ